MKKILLGSRKESPCYFDMAARFPWNDGRINYGRGFRIGDRAGAYIRLRLWRLENPDRKLIVLEDSSFEEAKYAASISAEWMFFDIADEVWKLDPDEIVPEPLGENLYDQSLWNYWKDLRYYRPSQLVPNLELPVELLNQLKQDLPKQNIQSNFITLQPLFNAGYNEKRNREPQWWNELIEILSHQRDVVIIGTPHSNQALGPQAHPRTKVMSSSDPIASLALMSLSSVFVGGETGLTLWAPIFQVPTAGFMCRDHKGYVMDTAPLSFGAPVNCFPIESDPTTAAAYVLKFMKDHQL